MITYGSTFTGIGGFDRGFDSAGMTCRWQVEIDDACQRVLSHRWPDVTRHRDIRDVRGDELEPVDVICGGFPCQDLSVAGRRAGLHGERSSMFFEFMRVVKEMRDATRGVCPAIVVIENVPGLLSSNGGADFGVLLDTLAELGALDIAWTCLDAQWFRVAQRRRRVFVVADFARERCGEILALTEGLSGHPPPRREEGQGIAGGTENGAGSSIHFDVRNLEAKGSVYGTLQSKPNGGQSLNYMGAVAHTLSAEGADASEDGTGRGTPVIASQMAVRRLTPTECLRLSGLPDDWLDLDPPLSDSTKYRMCGNAVVCNVAEWIGKRIVETVMPSGTDLQ